MWGWGQTNLGLNQTFGRVSADPVAILLVPLLPPGVGGGGEPSFQTRPLQIYWCGKAGPHPLLLLVFALKKTSEFLTKLWRSQVCQQVVFFFDSSSHFFLPNLGSVHSCGETASARPHFRRARVNLLPRRSRRLLTLLCPVVVVVASPRQQHRQQNLKIRFGLHIPAWGGGGGVPRCLLTYVNSTLGSILDFCHLLISGCDPAARPPSGHDLCMKTTKLHRAAILIFFFLFVSLKSLQNLPGGVFWPELKRQQNPTLRIKKESQRRHRPSGSF